MAIRMKESSLGAAHPPRVHRYEKGVVYSESTTPPTSPDLERIFVKGGLAEYVEDPATAAEAAAEAEQPPEAPTAPDEGTQADSVDFTAPTPGVLTIDEVMQRVADGKWDAAATLQAEREGNNRVTLIQRLERLTE